MLGLWSIHSAPISTRLHVAFQTPLDHLLRAPDYLRTKGVVPRGFGGGADIREPTVFPWMPAASVYFADPDGHSLEYITLLAEAPRPDIEGAVTWSEWRQLHDAPF